MHHLKLGYFFYFFIFNFAQMHNVEDNPDMPPASKPLHVYVEQESCNQGQRAIGARLAAGFGLSGWKRAETGSRGKLRFDGVITKCALMT